MFHALGRRSPGDYAVVDTRSKSVVMFSRIYDKHAHKICREEAVPRASPKQNRTCHFVERCKFREENRDLSFCRMLLVEFEKLQLSNYFQTN